MLRRNHYQFSPGKRASDRLLQQLRPEAIGLAVEQEQVGLVKLA
jgi:hypothetical protein